MSKLWDNLKEIMENEENKNSLEDWVEKYFWKYKVDELWANKFRNIPIEKRNHIIEKIIEKYNSKEYNSKEYKAGRQPNNDLYQVLYEYGKLYGEDVAKEYINEYDPFLAGAYRFDDSWNIILLMGQGALFKVFKD